MRILISGASGFLGRNLTQTLMSAGNAVIPLQRGEKWNPEKNILDQKLIENYDVIINLSGENVAGRWTQKKKQAILESRIQSTKLIADAINHASKPPSLFINASAIGYYGDRKNEILTEESAPGDNFLADVCIKWEAEAQKAQTRVVTPRFGVVLGPEGALKNMLTPFKLGLGGNIGSGDQYWSWIQIVDLVQIILHIIDHRDIKGPVNAVAPEAVTNKDFTRTLGGVLGRPTFFNMPEFAAKLVFGQMGEELLLSSERVKPAVLEKTGFKWNYPKLADALRHSLG